jgi:hypothetical protein
LECGGLTSRVADLEIVARRRRRESHDESEDQGPSELARQGN